MAKKGTNQLQKECLLYNLICLAAARYAKADLKYSNRWLYK